MKKEEEEGHEVKAEKICIHQTDKKSCVKGIINGKKYDACRKGAASVTIRNGKVYIGGEKIEPKGEEE